MTVENIKALLDACYQAKRARELLPELPKGDISDALNIPRPGVTRTVKEMEQRGYLEKKTSPDDGRVTYLTVTESGKRLSGTFNGQVFAQLAPLLEDVPDEDVACTIRTVQKLYTAVSERRISLEY